jgi:hypothetical protein
MIVLRDSSRDSLNCSTDEWDITGVNNVILDRRIAERARARAINSALPPPGSTSAWKRSTTEV